MASGDSRLAKKCNIKAVGIANCGSNVSIWRGRRSSEHGTKASLKTKGGSRLLGCHLRSKLEGQSRADLDLPLRENAVARLCGGAKKSVVVAILELERGTRDRVHQGAHCSDVPVIEQVKRVTREHETDLLPDFETLCQSQVNIHSTRQLERVG